MTARALLCLTLLGACSDSESPTTPHPDAKALPDGGSAQVPDGAASAPDGGVTAPDSGASAPDSPVTTSPDAGSVVTITGVSIQDSPDSTQIRQGSQFTLVVTGTHLADAVSADLGGGEFVSLAAVTETQVEVHGNFLGAETPGVRTLTLHTLTGQATFAGAVTVTPVTVTLAGNDANLGTPDHPLRTLTAGLLANGTGNTVNVGAGQFDVGEAAQPRVAADQVLAGFGSDQTTIARSIVIAPGGKLQGVRILGTQTQCVFDEVSPGTAPTVLKDVRLEGCVTGLLLRNSADLVEVTVPDAVSAGIQIEPAEAATVTMTNVEVTVGEGATGIRIAGQTAAGLDHVTISGSKNVGLEVAGLSLITVRNSDISTVAGDFGDRSTAVYVTSSGEVVDFGTDTDSGGNTLSGDIWSLQDDRAERDMADGPIMTISGSTLRDVVIPSAIYTGVTTQGYLNIKRANNRVQVF